MDTSTGPGSESAAREDMRRVGARGRVEASSGKRRLLPNEMEVRSANIDRDQLGGGRQDVVLCLNALDSHPTSAMQTP